VRGLCVVAQGRQGKEGLRLGASPPESRAAGEACISGVEGTRRALLARRRERRDGRESYVDPAAASKPSMRARRRILLESARRSSV
jgi:hypothetical protein